MTDLTELTGASTRAISLLERRAATIGPYSPTFYDEPIELVSGEGVWLTAADGTRYLDAYNNVPCVGHANPVVRRAIDEQLGRVNLHTRYLNDRVVDYAERLLATFEPPLDRVFFTNSGSEANELALRLAAQHTGAAGLIVTDWSYHGNTTSLAVATTALAHLEPLGAHVRPVHVPDGATADASARARLLSEGLAAVDAAIASLVAAGHGVCAVLFDPLFTTEGLVQPPVGYVEGLCARVQAAGGLVIADEVQSGFGRAGGVMWGHALYSISPDIVSLGKPMGNGQPIGAAVTTRALLEEFGSRNLYFNTFAGNPVSAAAGTAVLDVIERDRLLDHAAELGRAIAERLTRVARSYPGIGAVRGRGLFFGIDFVRPDGTPDAQRARVVVERMKASGVLISRIGAHDNVLKMRPPLVIGHDDAMLMLDRLESCLHADTGSDQ